MERFTWDSVQRRPGPCGSTRDFESTVADRPGWHPPPVCSCRFARQQSLPALNKLCEVAVSSYIPALLPASSPPRRSDTSGCRDGGYPRLGPRPNTDDPVTLASGALGHRQATVSARGDIRTSMPRSVRLEEGRGAAGRGRPTQRCIEPLSCACWKGNVRLLATWSKHLRLMTGELLPVWPSTVKILMPMEASRAFHFQPCNPAIRLGTASP